MSRLSIAAFLIAAALLEAGGDAILRKALQAQAAPARLALFLGGAAVLFAYGVLLNLAPLDFGKVVGLYIAAFFVVWQVITYFAFGTLPTLPVLAGGVLIVAGGLIVSFWTLS